MFSKASLISVNAAIVAFLQLCQYNIPFLTPTKMFWIHKLTYFLFIDVFHGIVVPLNMEVPWDLGRSSLKDFYVGGHKPAPRRCQGEECRKFLALELRRGEGEKIRKCKMDLRKIHRACHQGRLAPSKIMQVAEYSRNPEGERANEKKSEMKQNKDRRHEKNPMMVEERTKWSTDDDFTGFSFPSTSLFQNQQVGSPVVERISSPGQDPLIWKFSQDSSTSSPSPPPSCPSPPPCSLSPPSILHRPPLPPPPPSASIHLLVSRLSQILPSSPIKSARLPKIFQRKRESGVGGKNDTLYCRTCALKDLERTSKRKAQ